MSGPKDIAYVGCKTSHGGVIKTGCHGFTLYNDDFPGGLAVAREGDIVSCPLPFHGDNPILKNINASGAKINGRYIATDGWVTACGARIIVEPTEESLGEPDVSVDTDEGIDFIVEEFPGQFEKAPNAPIEPLKYDQRIYVRGPDGLPVVGQKYSLEYGETKTGTLTTGQSGETEIIKADYPHDLKIHFEKTDDLPPPKGDLSKPVDDIKEPFDVIPLKFDANAVPHAHTCLTVDSFIRRQVVRLPPQTVIPVIFVPGIMGSNLVDLEGKPAWQPPNTLGEGAIAAFQGHKQKAKNRQTSLDPKNTKVGAKKDFKFPGSKETLDGSIILDDKEARRRGWDEIHWDSYGDILSLLEESINNRTSHKLQKERDNHIKKDWHHLKGKFDTPEDDLIKAWDLSNIISKLNDAEIAKLGDYYFPVHAVGYNWLQSNGDSAKRLSQKVQEFLSFYQAHAYYKNINKVILVTHSMGGLVARACAKNENSKILGIIHGVQPVNGAPVVYRRMRAGTEVESFGDGLLRNWGAAQVLGPTAADITAVMANSPGALELLPNKLYNGGKPWLKVKHKDPATAEIKKQRVDPEWQSFLGRDYHADVRVLGTAKTRECFSLPRNKNPYKEIYGKSVQDVWWGMVDENLIDPANLIKNQGKNPLNEYKNILRLVEHFHENLSDYFFHNTHAYYGDFQSLPGYHEVVWLSRDENFSKVTDEELEKIKIATKAQHIFNQDREINEEINRKLDEIFKDEYLHGGAEIIAGHSRMTFNIQKRHPDDNDISWGDGTVPSSSAKGVSGKVKIEIPFKASNDQEAQKTPFDHQNSYKNRAVQLCVLWSITQFVKDLP